MANTKTCTKCNKTKKLTDFRPPSRTTGRIHSWCKDCLNFSCGEYRKKNLEKYQAKSRIYSQNITKAETEHFAQLKRRYQEKKYYKTRRKNLSEKQRCKERENSKLWKKQNPEYSSFYHLKRYSLSVEEYNIMLANQDGVCAICGLPPKTRKLGVDHCHTSGKIRGLLCHNCNVVLGLIKDDPDILTRAIDYLKINL